MSINLKKQLMTKDCLCKLSEPVQTGTGQKLAMLPLEDGSVTEPTPGRRRRPVTGAIPALTTLSTGHGAATPCRPVTPSAVNYHTCTTHTHTHYLSTYGRRAFSYAGPSAWNSLPEHLRAPDLTLNSFRHSLKTFLFTQLTHAAHWRLLVIVGYTSLLFTLHYTHTHL